MENQQTLQVQHGIWIDEQRLYRAGLSKDLQIIVQPGEIRIVNAKHDDEPQELSKTEWEVFLDLGRDAPPGKLINAAAEHDRYLYGNP